MLPYTRVNPSVEVFRHAMSIDERRRMFRLSRWAAPQPFVVNRFDTSAPDQAQDIKQVWFAGVHADVGGGYPETESGLSKFPLAWMIDEAAAHGLKTNTAMMNHLVLGCPREGGRNVYVAPDARGPLHDSLTPAWKILEWLPKATKWEEWKRHEFLGYYIPNGEPRLIADASVKPLVHQSVIDRSAQIPAYAPANFPDEFDVEP